MAHKTTMPLRPWAMTQLLTDVPPTVDGLIFVHRDIPGIQHQASDRCLCEPVLFRRMEHSTVNGLLDAMKAHERLN